MKIENALKGNNSLIFQQRVVCSLIYFTQSLQKIDLQVKSMTFTYIHQLYMLYIVHAHVHLNPIHVVDIFVSTESLLTHLPELFLW